MSSLSKSNFQVDLLLFEIFLKVVFYLCLDSLETGSPAVMTCSYKLTSRQYVDSVKWYLNSSEIYRIVPSLTHSDR